jgi:hypothetical protein
MIGSPPGWGDTLRNMRDEMTRKVRITASKNPVIFALRMVELLRVISMLDEKRLVVERSRILPQKTNTTMRIILTG